MNLAVWMEYALEYVRPVHAAVWRTTYYVVTHDRMAWMSAVEVTEVDGALVSTTCLVPKQTRPDPTKPGQH